MKERKQFKSLLHSCPLGEVKASGDVKEEGGGWMRKIDRAFPLHLVPRGLLNLTRKIEDGRMKGRQFKSLPHSGARGGVKASGDVKEEGEGWMRKSDQAVSLHLVHLVPLV